MDVLFKRGQVCNTMGQGHFSSLTLLAIERTLAESLEKTPGCYDRAAWKGTESRVTVCMDKLKTTTTKKHVVGLAKRCFLCLKGQQSPLPCTSGQRQVHEGMVEQEFSAESTVTSTLQITFGKN